MACQSDHCGNRCWLNARRSPWKNGGRSSLLAQQHLLGLEEYAQARCIALYAPARNEADTAEIVASAFMSGKRVLYPAVCGEHMVFRQVEGLTSLEKGSYGILEPCPTGVDHHAR